MTAHKVQGFTLLEILIAMAVFTIMSVMAYSGLKAVLTAKARTTEKSERLAQLQMTLYLLNEDLAQAVARPIRDEFGTTEAAFIGETDKELLTFTRMVPSWTKYQPGSQLQRVSYRFEKGGLYRLVWSLLDRTQQSTYRRQKLLNIQQIQLRFFQGDWLSTWSSEKIPKAVECHLFIAGLGDIKRLFYIHNE
jgi:general secretion pathway protein J